MKSIRKFFARHWQTMLLIAMLFSLGATLYWYGVRTFIPGLSAAEVQTITQSSTWQGIVQNPLWLPFKLIYLALHKIDIQPSAYRYVSGFFAMLSVAAFYSVCTRWYSPRVSALTTILFGTSVTTITIARVATPAILLYSWLWCIALIAWFQSSRKTRLAPLLLLFFSTFMLYTPGFVWFALILGVWFSKEIPIIFKHMKNSWIVMGTIIGLIFIVPLVYSFVQDPKLIKSWLLIPQTLDLRASLLYIKDLPAAFLYRSESNPVYNLGRLPFLEALSGTLLLVGLYAYRTRLRLNRTVIYVVSILLAMAIAALNRNQIYLIFCLPFIYLLIAEGIGFLLSEWRAVFPRNPIARFFGTLLMTVAILAASWYHIQRYFLAYTNNPDTKKVYSQRIE